MTMATVHVLIPVFNRLALTQAVMGCLRQQRGVTLKVIVVDDGSSDGTADYLATQPDVHVLRGDGSLWWGGAMELGLRFVLPITAPEDFVLFVNNDTEFADNFVAELVAASERNGRAAVGSIIRHSQTPEQVLSLGPQVDYWSFRIWDLNDADAGRKLVERGDDIDMPMLSGRGTLYPVEAFRKAGCMRPRLLPHYFADYELADRVRRAGTPIKITSSAAVISLPEWGNEGRHLSRWQRLFSRRSATNIFFYLAFWCLVGSPLQRVTAIPRWLFQRTKRLVLSPLWKYYENSRS
jgi:GT2 family glycosyltransferase